MSNETYNSYLDAEGLALVLSGIRDKINAAAEGITNTKGKANGIASLDAGGNVPLSQLGNLDTTFFEVVTELPTDIRNIKKHIYILKGNKDGDNNKYVEYIYTGDLTDAGDLAGDVDATKWEKLGDFVPTFDLQEYVKKAGAVAKLKFYDPVRDDTWDGDDDQPSETAIRIGFADGSHQYLVVPEVTAPINTSRSNSELSDSEKSKPFIYPGRAGFMSAGDKGKLDKIDLNALTASINAANTAANNTNKAIQAAETATAGAEKVNATLTEENVFEVTDRTGTKKSLDLSGLVSAQDTIKGLQNSKIDKTSISQETGESEDKVMSQKAVSTKLNDLSNKIGDILGTEEKILYENLELSSEQTLELPTDIPDNTLVQVSLLTATTNDNGVIFYAYDENEQTMPFVPHAMKYNFPISILYKQCKKLKVYFRNISKINIKVALSNKGLLDQADKLLYRGTAMYNINIGTLNLKAGDQILIKNVVTSNTEHPIQFYVYKDKSNNPFIAIYPKNETTLTVEEGVGEYVMSKPFSATDAYDSVLEVYLVSSENKLTNNLISQPLSEYDFIAAGDSITAWGGNTNPGVAGVKNFEGWANLLNAQIGFKTYKNIAVPGASYSQSSVVGGITYSINRAIKENLPEGFKGIFTMMGATNDYNGKTQLGTATETMAKTYEELDQKDKVSGFDTICDGFRYCLETAIRRCSWRARIFVMTCLPLTDRSGYFTVAEMNEQIKLISKAFNVPVLDLFSELNFRNGLDQFGETWKLSEEQHNAHPNAEAQKMMMRFVFGKLLTYIR